MNHGTCLDRELAPKDPELGPMGLPPWLEGWANVIRWSGDLAAAIGSEVAVKLAKGLWIREWVDIIKTSIRIWPIRSLKSEYTAGGTKRKVRHKNPSLIKHKKPRNSVGVTPTIFRVLMKLDGQWREIDNIPVLLLPWHTEDPTNELQGLFFWHIRV